MLKPEDLETIADGVQELWGEFEEDILKDIAERIKNCNYKINATAAWRLSILEDLNEQSDYVTQQLAKYLETSEKQVKDIINNTVIDQVKSDKAMYEEAKDEGLIERSDFTPGTINPIVSKGIKATNGTIRNFTKSTVANSNTQLTHYLDLAYLNVQSGNMSIDEAVKNSVDQLAGKGVIENVYNGRTEQIETVVGRAVRTGTNMIVGRSTLAIADDLGCDLVEVSSHLGARPTHAVWQGKVYSRSGKSNIYPDFVKSTEYGTGEGLLGWNCGIPSIRTSRDLAQCLFGSTV